jgi:predicted XRE-type DNA-binding protein
MKKLPYKTLIFDGKHYIAIPLDEYDAFIENVRAQAPTVSKPFVDENLSEEEQMSLKTAKTPLAFWRKKRGIRQKEISELLGISQTYASEIEYGKRTGQPIDYLKLAQALNIKVEQLITDPASPAIG